MSTELLITLATTAGVLILFLTEALRIDIVALLAMTVLLVAGVLTPEQGLSGFANEATITIAAMFVISDGFRRTGALNFLGETIGRLFGVNETLALMTMMAGVAMMSAFVNNTAVVAILLPTVIAMCRRYEISLTRVLMPLSFAAMFGGLTTLIGTSTNLIVSSILVDHGMEGIGMFEMTTPGIIFFLVGTTYLITIGRHLIPARPGDANLAEDYQMMPYFAEVGIGPGCSACGKKLAEAEIFGGSDLEVIGILRGNEELRATPDRVLEATDVLRLRGTIEELRKIEKQEDIEIHPLKSRRADAFVRHQDHQLFEAVVAPDSVFVGRSLEEVDFSGLSTASVLALRSRGHLMYQRLTQERLRGGDVLLMEASAAEIARLKRHPAFVVVSGVGEPEHRSEMIVPVTLVIAAVVAIAALGILPIVVTAIAGAIAVVLMGVVDVEQAYDSIDWQIIFLLAGVIPLGIALQDTGGVTYVAEALTGWLGVYGPLALLAGIYLVTTFTTDMISNQATAILLTPIAIGAASSIGADPRVFAIAIAFAASASFATPVGYQTNTLIYGAGDYRFLDFVKVGLPLNFIFWGVAIFYLPEFWPF